MNMYIRFRFGSIISVFDSVRFFMINSSVRNKHGPGTGLKPNWTETELIFFKNRKPNQIWSWFGFGWFSVRFDFSGPYAQHCQKAET